jgi:myo-inositol-1(or 4)-monophosphatase
MSKLTDPPLPLLAETAASAARSAGALLLEVLRKERQVQFKGEIDLVTDVDRRSEQAIVSILLSRFPEHRILAEEGTTGGNGSEYRWIIDPLDGTTNYTHRYPHFAVSLAVERDGELLVGVVYDPVRDELFQAQVGGGAFVNGHPLRVSSVSQLLRSLTSTGFPYDRQRFGPSLRKWEHFIRHCQAVRRDGSAALDLCYVAAGRFDGFWEDHLHPWDAAAGVLLVREAGGVVTDSRGEEVDLFTGDIVATNGLLHASMLAGLAEVEASRAPDGSSRVLGRE